MLKCLEDHPHTTSPGCAIADATVLYDADCPLCRSLAGLVARRAAGTLQLEPWQAFVASPAGVAAIPAAARAWPADRLRVLTGETLLEGEGAWAFLLERYRDLAGLNWLASRLGLSQQAAQVLQRSSSLVKRMCRRCGATGDPVTR